MNQREDGPHWGHEKAPFNSAELMPPPVRTESFWEPLQRLRCSLKEQNGLSYPTPEKPEGQVTPVMVHYALLAFHATGSPSTHSFRYDNRADCWRVRPAFCLCAYTLGSFQTCLLSPCCSRYNDKQDACLKLLKAHKVLIRGNQQQSPSRLRFGKGTGTKAETWAHWGKSKLDQD